MTAADLITSLASAGVQLYLAGDILRFRAAAGAYMPEHRRLVSENRKAIAAVLAGVPMDVGDDLTPAAHLALLGRYDGVKTVYGIEAAHRLWDSVRLWERDRGTPREERWHRQYWAAWQRVRR